MTPWALRYDPRDWQVKALEKWLPQKRGIVEVVTGGRGSCRQLQSQKDRAIA